MTAEGLRTAVAAGARVRRVEPGNVGARALVEIITPGGQAIFLNVPPSVALVALSLMRDADRT